MIRGSPYEISGLNPEATYLGISIYWIPALYQALCVGAHG